MKSGDEGTKSTDVEIFFEDGPDPKASIPSSSSFFKQTSENINTALLDLLEDAFQKDGVNPAAFAPSDQESSGSFNSANQAPAPALRDHPWFRPPKKEELAAKHSQDADFILSNPRQAFFRQAELYAGQEGAPSEEVPFSSYFPNYGAMGQKQLDWYFYWRSSVRRKIFIKTDVSYVFLYFYELIHQVGFLSAEDALHQILFVWKEARIISTVFDSYLAVWVRDFILYYGVDAQYYAVVEEVLGEDTGRYLYQECILYFINGEKKTGFLHALEALSDYPVTCGRYFRDGYGPLLENAVCHVFSFWNSRYAEKGKDSLLGALCGDIPRRSMIRPFESALFYEHGQMGHTGESRINSGITVDFLPRTFESSLIPGLSEIRKVRRFITGLLRTVESNLRNLTGYRWSIQKGHLPKGQLSLMDKQCALFYQEYMAEKKRSEKKVFHVNSDLLIKLKKESEQIREHLISRQEQADMPYDGISGHAAGGGTADEGAADRDAAYDGVAGCSTAAVIVPADVIETDDGSACPGPPFSIEPCFSTKSTSVSESLLPVESAVSAESSFSELFGRFGRQQFAMVSLLVDSMSSGTSSGRDFPAEFRAIASSSNTYPDVIIEEINDLSVDCIGDCIIDSGGAFPSLFPDYLDEIKEAMSNGGK